MLDGRTNWIDEVNIINIMDDSEFFRLFLRSVTVWIKSTLSSMNNLDTDVSKNEGDKVMGKVRFRFRRDLEVLTSVASVDKRLAVVFM